MRSGFSLAAQRVPARPAPSIAKAALWAIGSISAFSLMAVAGRELADGFTPFEILFWRSLVGLAIVLVLIQLSRPGLAQIATAWPGLHGVRNIGHFFGQSCWFYAVGAIPLAQVFALEFTTPIWVLLAAPLVLGEAFTKWRALAAVLGFAGILLVIRPDQGAFSFAHFIAMAAAWGFAVNVMATKRLSATETTLCILFWMTLSQTVFAFVCQAVWAGELWPKLPGTTDALWLGAMASRFSSGS
ncbi:MAG: DMT family transporter [Pseudomonadota bacterium]